MEQIECCLQRDLRRLLEHKSVTEETTGYYDVTDNVLMHVSLCGKGLGAAIVILSRSICMLPLGLFMMKTASAGHTTGWSKWPA